MANINAIKLPDGNKYNLVDETSGYITSSDLPTPLIGTTANTTPTQVVTALAAGRNIEITHTDTTYGDVIAYSFNYAEDIGRISSNAAISVFGTLILTKLVGNTNDNTWNFEAHELAQLSNIPTATSDLTNDSGFVTTDENLKTTALDIGNSMYLIGGSSSESTGTKLTDGALLYTRYLSGRCWLSIGKASTEGILRLYNAKSGAVYTTLRPNADITTSNTIYLPGLDGTLALTSNIPTKTSDLTNDSGFITSYTETDPVFSASAAAGITSSDISNWNGKSNFSGDYNDLSNKPSIPTYTEISEANIKQGSSSTVGLITGRRARQAVETYSPVKDVTVDGVSVVELNSADIDLTGKSDVGHTHTKSAITDFPTTVSSFTNDAGYITGGTSTPTADTVAEFDSSAHMKSTDMTAAEVTNFVNSLNVTGIHAVDYVVEEGKSGDSSYRKWNSGIAECWIRTEQNVAINGAYGSLFQGTWTWNFPITFITGPAVTCSHFKWGSGASWGTVSTANTTSASLRSIDISSRASGSCVISAYAIGRWK